MWTGRLLPWLLLPVGATLLTASWAALTLSRDVDALRAPLRQHVTWMIDIRVVQMAAGEAPPPRDRLDVAVERLRSSRSAMEEALGDDPDALASLDGLQGALSDAPDIDPEAVATGHEVVGALRQRTAAISGRLDAYWDGLHRLVAWAIALSVLCMGLFVLVVVIRAREARLWQTLQELSEQRAHLAETRRGSAIARFRRDLQQLIEAMPVGIGVIVDDTIRFANPALGRLLGRPGTDDLLGTQLDLDETVFELSGSTEIEWDERPARVAVVQDLSEQRALEARIRLADRLSSVSTMAAGVAHEINNPLTWVTLDLEELAHRLSGSDEETELIEPIRDGLHRIAEIVGDLSAFGRGAAAPDRPTPDLVTLLRSTARIADVTQPDGIDIVVEADGRVPPVVGSEARLAQVFLNLIVNGAEATARGPGAGTVRVTVHEPRDSTITVDVTDDGPGIPDAHRDRLFDPFFTTKPVGGGPGLGLFVCHQSVTHLGGRIEVTSAAGEGARFRVTLPLAPGASPPPPGAPDTAPDTATDNTGPDVG